MTSNKNIPCSILPASYAIKSSDNKPIPVAVLLGPTAIGKSSLAFELACELNGDIISCDSRQIYKKMSIGTAKPTECELARVKHWLVDVIDPSEEYSAYRFGKEAAAIIRRQAATGRPVIVCGGTGLYFRALSEGLIEREEPDSQLRLQLMDRAAKDGSAALHQELLHADPVSAARVHQNDLQRIVRALALFKQTGRPMSACSTASTPPLDMHFRVIILHEEREKLYKKIDQRVLQMVENGLVQEFEQLLSMAYTADSPGMRCVGYRELFAYKNGDVSLDAATRLIQQNTRRYAKRQVTWFTHQVDGVRLHAAVGYERIRDVFLGWEEGERRHSV